MRKGEQKGCQHNLIILGFCKVCGKPIKHGKVNEDAPKDIAELNKLLLSELK